MKKNRFTEEQIAYALIPVELGTAVPEICRKLGIAATGTREYHPATVHPVAFEDSAPNRPSQGQATASGGGCLAARVVIRSGNLGISSGVYCLAFGFLQMCAKFLT